MRVIRWVLCLSLFILFLAFALQNTEPVVLGFYGLFSWRTPLIVLLLVSLVVGVVLGLAASRARKPPRKLPTPSLDTYRAQP